MFTLSEDHIKSLIEERKSLPPQLCPLGTLTGRSHHKRKDFTIPSSSGNQFVVFVRLSTINMLDFSVILGYRLPHLHSVFRLRRYNGKSHYHTNVMENETFYDFHIHAATERYQQAGFSEDHFAKKTNRYHDLQGAIDLLLDECGFRSPIEESPLFQGQTI
ncbi:MAG: hypothetical protein ABSF98_26890 [Bryobacteraceae bacterium]